MFDETLAGFGLPEQVGFKLALIPAVLKFAVVAMRFLNGLLVILH